MFSHKKKQRFIPEGEKILAEFWTNVLTNLLQNVKFQHLLHPWEPTGYLVSPISHSTLLSYSFKSNHFETNLLRQAQSSTVFLVSPWASVNLTELEHVFNQRCWTQKRPSKAAALFTSRWGNAFFTWVDLGGDTGHIDGTRGAHRCRRLCAAVPVSFRRSADLREGSKDAWIKNESFAIGKLEVYLNETDR